MTSSASHHQALTFHGSCEGGQSVHSDIPRIVPDAILHERLVLLHRGCGGSTSSMPSTFGCELSVRR